MSDDREGRWVGGLHALKTGVFGGCWQVIRGAVYQRTLGSVRVLPRVCLRGADAMMRV